MPPLGGQGVPLTPPLINFTSPSVRTNNNHGEAQRGAGALPLALAGAGARGGPRAWRLAAQAAAAPQEA
eukprot:3413419-Prymnesium_polylepis.1